MGAINAPSNGPVRVAGGKPVTAKPIRNGEVFKKNLTVKKKENLSSAGGKAVPKPPTTKKETLNLSGGNAVPKPTVTTSPTGSPVLSAHAAHQLHVVHMAHLAHLAHTPNAKTIQK